MQVYDDDLHSGQRSSGVKCGKLCAMVTIFVKRCEINFVFDFVFSSCTYICGALSLWHTDVSVYLSVYLSIRPQLEKNASSLIYLDGFS